MAQRGRRVLRKADPAPPQTRRVRLDRRTPSRHKPLLEGNQRCPKTLHLDRRPRQDHRRRATRAPNVRFDPLDMVLNCDEFARRMLDDPAVIERVYHASTRDAVLHVGVDPETNTFTLEPVPVVVPHGPFLAFGLPPFQALRWI